MEQNKFIYVVLIDKHNQQKILAQIEVTPESTLKNVIDSGNGFVKQKGVIPDRYSLRLYLNKTTEIPSTVLYDPKYSNQKLYSQLDGGYLYYIPDKLSKLDRNTLLTLVSKMDGKTLTNLCQTSRRMVSLCRDENFWRQLTLRKFGSIELDVYPTWKSFYLDTLGPKTKIQLQSAILGTNLGEIEITLYTPLIIFLNKIAEITLKSSPRVITVFLENYPKYHYFDLRSLPESIPEGNLIIGGLTQIPILTTRVPESQEIERYQKLPDKIEYNPYFTLSNGIIATFALYLKAFAIRNGRPWLQSLIAAADLKGGYKLIKGTRFGISNNLYRDDYYIRRLDKYFR